MKKAMIVLGILYMPFYLVGVIIDWLARLQLSIGNLFLLNFRMSKDIFKSLFDGKNI